MSSDLHALIKSLDLSQIEGEIFEHLLEFGYIKAVDLRKVLHIERTPFYRTLSLLEEKNLITISGDLRKQVIHINEFSEINQVLEDKRKQMTIAQQSLANLKANMRQLRDNRYRNDNVEVISGPDAYLNAMQSLIRGGGKILRDITPDSATLYQIAGSKEKYERIVSEIKSERLKLNISIRILFDNQAKVIDDLSMTNPITLKESRVLNSNLHLGCYLNTCGSKTLFYTKDVDSSWGIIIKDELITNLMNSLFDVLWNQSTRL